MYWLGNMINCSIGCIGGQSNWSRREKFGLEGVSGPAEAGYLTPDVDGGPSETNILCFAL